LIAFNDNDGVECENDEDSHDSEDSEDSEDVSELITIADPKYPNIKNAVTKLWSHDRLYRLIDYIQEHFNAYEMGKDKLYERWLRQEKVPTTAKNVRSVRTKMYSMLEAYYAVRKHNESSGSIPMDWEWFEIMDNTFRKLPTVSPPKLADSDGNITIREIQKEPRKKKTNDQDVVATAFRNIATTIHSSQQIKDQRQNKEWALKEWEYRIREKELKIKQRMYKLKKYKYRILEKKYEAKEKGKRKSDDDDTSSSSSSSSSNSNEDRDL
jgi:hypothetical protein